jgi:hypothetical protein
VKSDPIRYRHGEEVVAGDLEIAGSGGEGRGGEMANKSYERQESNGLGWASQWGNNFDEDVSSTPTGAGHKGSSKEKLAEVNKKVKAVASTGMEKTKEVVTVGAHKVKTGTSSGLRWIKEKVQQKKK